MRRSRPAHITHWCPAIPSPPNKGVLQPADLTAVLHLVDCCDATAAALRRFNVWAEHIQTNHAAPKNRDAVLEAFVPHLADFYHVHERFYGRTPRTQRFAPDLEARIDELRLNTSAAIISANINTGENRDAIGRATTWLQMVYVLGTIGPCVVPSGDGYAPNDLFGGSEERNRELCDHRFAEQCELVRLYDTTCRRQLLQVLVSAGVKIPSGLMSRNYWFTWRVDNPPISNDELLAWLGPPPSAGSSAQTSKRKKVDAKKEKKQLLNDLQQQIVALHVLGASNQDTANLAILNDQLKRLAKNLGKQIDAAFVQSCRVAQRNKNRNRETPKGDG